MRLYDISQEVFSSAVYPGDPVPARQQLCAMEQGEVYNLSAFSMCAHNGTHVDAPAHFIADGSTVDQIPLERLVGPARVITCKGEITADTARAILADGGEGSKRLLLRGGVVSDAAAKVLADGGVWLVGSDTQSVGDENAPASVHRILLSAEVVLLEGLRLAGVADGTYFLFAAPLKLGGCEGAPCRAILAEM